MAKASEAQKKAFKKYQTGNRKKLSSYAKWWQRNKKLKIEVLKLKTKVAELELVVNTYKEYIKENRRYED